MTMTPRPRHLVPRTMPRTRRLHDLDDIIDWLSGMNLFVTHPPDPDLPSDNDLQQEADAQRSQILADSNMAQQPASPPAREANAGSNDVAIVVQTVYKTLTPTFSGPIGGYSTLFQDDDATPSTASQRALSPASTPPFSPSPAPSPSTTQTSMDGQSAKSPDVSSSPTASASGTPSLSSTSRAVSDHPTSSKASVPVMTDRVALLPSASRPTAPASTADLSMSKKESAGVDSSSNAGVKTGIAFGVLGGVIAVVLLAYFLFNRRRKQAAAGIRLDDGDEKSPVAGLSPFETPSMRGDPRAPRISLRPAHFTPLGTAWDRPNTSRGSNATNPFGIQAERVPSTITEEQSMRSNSASPGKQFDAALPPASQFSQDTLGLNGRTAAAGAILGAATGLSRKISMSKDGPRNKDLTLPRRNNLGPPPSPTETEFSMSLMPAGSAPPITKGTLAIAAAGGPANAGVHRVELKFKPTLDDEMDLGVGDLVRLLHEYDDGWCLVIRLNRSQQGVVPRTCLSTRPVKPRLAPGAQRPGPPVNPSGQFRGPDAARPGASETSRFRAVRDGGSTSPASSSRPQYPSGGRLVTPPHPGPSSLGPPPAGPPPPGPPVGRWVGRRPVPGQNLDGGSNWPREARPWAT